ncbi:MAG: hypothetical protein R2911_00905 [Caldilineaceae bacterium]
MKTRLGVWPSFTKAVVALLCVGCSWLWITNYAFLRGAGGCQRVTGNTWTVTSVSDDVNIGDLTTRKGTLRFALAHAVSGDLVLFAGNLPVDRSIRPPRW